MLAVFNVVYFQSKATPAQFYSYHTNHTAYHRQTSRTAPPTNYLVHRKHHRGPNKQTQTDAS
jgi:hypothetical protein